MRVSEGVAPPPLPADEELTSRVADDARAEVGQMLMIGFHGRKAPTG
jgi:hypothetical protein